MSDRCRSCKAPIRWAITESGQRMPFDPEPNDAGEWRLASSPRGRPPRCVHVPEERRAALKGELLAPHWATCPYADKHCKRSDDNPNGGRSG